MLQVALFLFAINCAQRLRLRLPVWAAFFAEAERLTNERDGGQHRLWPPFRRRLVDL
jgi:hypothetical protein